ncbi:FAD binding domain-containing protein [Kribbella ginsengisoli]|uniref:FAD binding domain-containing protein n=1 Tax=Kribbella ginsengisoli TaxID=363865 RepID=UPI003CD0C3A0
MRPAPFDYLAPQDLPEALSAVTHPDHVVLAGGQSLVPMLNRRHVRPRLVVDINSIEQLRGFSVLDTSVRLGSLTRHRWLEVSAEVARGCPALSAAARLIGDPEVRRRGTLGGSLSHAAPGAQLPTVAVLLNAVIEVAGIEGNRVISSRQFFVGRHRTALASGEVILAVQVPRVTSAEGQALRQFTRHSHGVNLVAAARVAISQDGQCVGADLAVGGADVPVLLSDEASGLVGARSLTAEQVSPIARGAAEVWVEAHAAGAGARHQRLAEVAIGGALLAAWRCAFQEGRIDDAH